MMVRNSDGKLTSMKQAIHSRKILTFVTVREEKSFPSDREIVKPLKISGPCSVAPGNHTAIKLPHDSHIPSLWKVLAHKRDKVSLHKTMGT